MQPPYREGTGDDIHHLVEGSALVLAGVQVPSAVGFDTHSDGDVLSHALVDALAGAIADGDLGTHFPEDDPEAWDARSLEFVEQFARHVRAAGYEIANVDCFVVLGTIKLDWSGCAPCRANRWPDGPGNHGRTARRAAMKVHRR